MSTDDLDPAPHGLGPDAPRSPSEEEGEPAAVTGTSKAFAPVQGADDSYELASVSDTESGNSTHSEDLSPVTQVSAALRPLKLKMTEPWDLNMVMNDILAARDKKDKTPSPPSSPERKKREAFDRRVCRRDLIIASRGVPGIQESRKKRFGGLPSSSTA